MSPGSSRPSVAPSKGVWRALRPTFDYWMQTEVHVYAFSIAANVLLGFFPFLIVCVSVGGLVFDRAAVRGALDLAFRDIFPSALGDFMQRNLPAPQPVELLSIFLLFFSANGIFEPLEVALNRVWGIHKNRSFVRNQLVSMVLIFGCGSLALTSLAVAAVQPATLTGLDVERWISALFYKSAAVPITVLVLFLVYRYLPNGRPPVNRVLPAAIGVGVMFEALKSLNAWLWPIMDAKLQREYGVFRYSATLIFLSFLAAMLMLGGAEWAARGHRLDGSSAPPDVPFDTEEPGERGKTVEEAAAEEARKNAKEEAKKRAETEAAAKSLQAAEAVLKQGPDDPFKDRRP